MRELTAENVIDYLREQGWIGPEPARAEALSWGVSNAVLRVETPTRKLVVKQSRPQLRTHDAWFSDLNRVFREQEVMQALQPLLPAETVPAVLHADRENYVFAMAHAPEPHEVWKAALLAGRIDQAIAARTGAVLGRMHEATARDTRLVEPFRDHTVFVQLRVEPFYQRIQERLPDVARLIDPLIEQLLTIKEALCHGDYSPKNILVHAGGFTLVDYETAHFGDPTMDLGFFLSHLLLKTIKRYRQRRDFFELTRTFWDRYAQQIRFRPVTELMHRSFGHLGVCLLARIDGTSPVDYLPEEPKRAAVRRLGRSLLRDRPRTWEEVLARLEDVCHELEKEEGCD
ncbi:MAG: phosphotransferase [Gemmataceae bacterium]|nr:phosphotransferase [Gemmataceae bacterium]MDW8266744.1 aminoglycoside phosphotransferase family protein [Gemmataceae bacterium]